MSWTLSSVHFTPSSAEAEKTGLLGYLRLGVGDLLMIDGVTLRRARDGRLVISYPRPGRRRHPLVRPLDDEARRAIEGAVLKALGVEGGHEG